MVKKNVLFAGLGSSPKDKIINVSILLVLAVILFFLIRWIIKKTKEPNREAASDLQRELNAGGRLTYTDTQYTTFATKLYAAMDGFGTNSSNVYSVFESMVTRADVLSLIVAFGVKKDETLQEWLYGDLSSRELKKVNKILSSKGINYQF